MCNEVSVAGVGRKAGEEVLNFCEGLGQTDVVEGELVLGVDCVGIVEGPIGPIHKGDISSLSHYVEFVKYKGVVEEGSKW